MAYVIAEPCIVTKDTACVDACPVDCIHPKKEATYDDDRPDFVMSHSSTSILWSASTVEPVFPSALSRLFCPRRPPGEMEATELNESYVKGGKFTPDEYAKYQGK